jgi:hypothetical protein
LHGDIEPKEEGKDNLRILIRRMLCTEQLPIQLSTLKNELDLDPQVQSGLKSLNKFSFPFHTRGKLPGLLKSVHIMVFLSAMESSPNTSRPLVKDANSSLHGKNLLLLPPIGKKWMLLMRLRLRWRR